MFPLPLDLFGQALAPLPIPTTPLLAGQTVYLQAFVLDAAAAQGVAMSPGLAATLCP